jgi:hypothetical protein
MDRDSASILISMMFSTELLLEGLRVGPGRPRGSDGEACGGGYRPHAAGGRSGLRSDAGEDALAMVMRSGPWRGAL